MGYFSVRIIHGNGKPANDIGVMIDYGIMNGTETKRTNSDGWVSFYNQSDKHGTIWVHGRKMGNHSLSDGKTYSYTL